ncbi:hypothetical protein LZ31DRAFT_146483 [Colletotrichum somersetense]|nr:hypothetical protein LZ31DRAFT_146483 [Colletotrichum somersetense]
MDVCATRYRRLAKESVNYIHHLDPVGHIDQKVAAQVSRCDEGAEIPPSPAPPPERWPDVRILHSAKELQKERDWPLTKKSAKASAVGHPYAVQQNGAGFDLCHAPSTQAIET